MSGQILEIKKKINGIKNTRKITKAMQLVAASKMRQFQKRAVHARSFVWDLLKVLKNNMEGRQENIYTEAREEGKTLFVLYTSDKGLCGSLNTKLINALFRSEKWTNLAPEDRALITIGKKSHNYAVSNKIPVLKSFVGIPEKFSTLDAIGIIDNILTLWHKDRENEMVDDAEEMEDHDEMKIKEVIFVSPHYKNSFTFYPVMKTFLPLSKESVKDILRFADEKFDFTFEQEEYVNEDNEDYEYKEEEPEEEIPYMLYEPDKEAILNRLYEQIIQSLFIESFLQLKASEYSSRMIAMQNATEAADKIINNLTLAYNKARQQAVTQEIAELIGASMAISDQE